MFDEWLPAVEDGVFLLKSRLATSGTPAAYILQHSRVGRWAMVDHPLIIGMFSLELYLLEVNFNQCSPFNRLPSYGGTTSRFLAEVTCSFGPPFRLFRKLPRFPRKLSPVTRPTINAREGDDNGQNKTKQKVVNEVPGRFIRSMKVARQRTEHCKPRSYYRTNRHQPTRRPVKFSLRITVPTNRVPDSSLARSH